MAKHILKRIIWTVVVLLGIATIMFVVFSFSKGDPADCILAKPVIYLYPEEETDVDVSLAGVDLVATWPASEGEWSVSAKPDGTLINKADGQEYSYIFWEGNSDIEYDFSEGFCVAGEDTAEFLRSTLSEMGLTAREYNEFIVYWMPLMQDNEYNIIAFQGDNYDAAAKLEITPKPDSILRVFMAWKASDEFVELPEQNISGFEREGFTVVEWGGCEVK